MALGWNFDMNINNLLGQSYADPNMNNLEKTANSMFPTTNECISIDVNIKKAKDLLSELTKERLSGYKINMTRPDKVKNVSYSYVQTYNKAIKERASYVNNMVKTILPKKILELENKFVELDCRNNIENKRLLESAEILTKQSATSEENVLSGNYKEQYIYIGLGALVLLVGLYVISKK